MLSVSAAQSTVISGPLAALAVCVDGASQQAFARSCFSIQEHVDFAGGGGCGKGKTRAHGRALPDDAGAGEPGNGWGVLLGVPEGQ